MRVLEAIPHECWSYVVHRIMRLAIGASELHRGDLSICMPKHMDTFMEFQSRFLQLISEWEPLIHTVEITHDHIRETNFLCTVLLSLSSLCVYFCLAPSHLTVPYYLLLLCVPLVCVSVCVSREHTSFSMFKQWLIVQLTGS